MYQFFKRLESPLLRPPADTSQWRLARQNVGNEISSISSPRITTTFFVVEFVFYNFSDIFYEIFELGTSKFSSSFFFMACFVCWM